MKRKKTWGISIGILAMLFLTIYIFRDDGTMSDFVSIEGHEQFTKAYDGAMEVLPEPIESRKIGTDFGEVQLYKFQENDTLDQMPLLLLPGKGASTPMWEPNLRYFLEHRPVYTLDLLGEPGLSTETKRIETAEDQAIWLEQVLEQLPESDIHLLGLSFGGWSATNVALTFPEKIQSLILVDPVYVFGPIPFKMIIASIPASVPIVPKPIRETMLSYISGGIEMDQSDPTANLIETGMRTYKSKLPMPKKIKPEQLAELEMPVLGILAGGSTMHHAEKSYQTGVVYLQNPNSEMVLFADASHAINGEYPEELVETIESFLGKLK
ncbi:pimeloyl-ACP methyl ester carboxylesterase [Lederbergia galactosidilyticus]|uniref:alpha/beta fold hydrolase n=1 Tax=Lederbergia galactosidilytica TaxID=217031 RepID=UPI001AE974CC|nr:alpha/beta hydrolase [Lederbergia galactosidilytica]MBP1917152.1 pimeloyl-ACP methyl ester carboxylesterase [Lederbergia galactosidilytica]